MAIIVTSTKIIPRMVQAQALSIFNRVAPRASSLGDAKIVLNNVFPAIIPMNIVTNNRTKYARRSLSQKNHILSMSAVRQAMILIALTEAEIIGSVRPSAPRANPDLIGRR